MVDIDETRCNAFRIFVERMMTLHGLIYTRLARFVVEGGGIFAESQLVQIFLSKIDKRLFELASPRIIHDYEGRAMLAQAFSVVERCDRALCQHDTAVIMDDKEYEIKKNCHRY